MFCLSKSKTGHGGRWVSRVLLTSLSPGTCLQFILMHPRVLASQVKYITSPLTCRPILRSPSSWMCPEILWSRAIKQKAPGPETAQQRLQSGPLDGKCEWRHTLWTFNFIFIHLTTFPADKGLLLVHFDKLLLLCLLINQLQLLFLTI